MLFSEWLESKGETVHEKYVTFFNEMQLKDLAKLDSALSTDSRHYVRSHWMKYKEEFKLEVK